MVKGDKDVTDERMEERYRGKQGGKGERVGRRRIKEASEEWRGKREQ